MGAVTGDGVEKWCGKKWCGEKRCGMLESGMDRVMREVCCVFVCYLLV